MQSHKKHLKPERAISELTVGCKANPKAIIMYYFFILSTWCPFFIDKGPIRLKRCNEQNLNLNSGYTKKQMVVYNFSYNIVITLSHGTYNTMP